MYKRKTYKNHLVSELEDHVIVEVRRRRDAITPAHYLEKLDEKINKSYFENKNERKYEKDGNFTTP